MLNISDVKCFELRTKFVEEWAWHASETNTEDRLHKEIAMTRNAERRIAQREHMLWLMRQRERARIEALPEARTPFKGHREFGAAYAKARRAHGNTLRAIYEAEMLLWNMGHLREPIDLAQKLFAAMGDWGKANEHYKRWKRVWGPGDLNIPHALYVLHAVHQSEGDATQVAYTPSFEYLERDRQVRLSPGRYLAKLGHLSDSEIKDMVNDYANQYGEIEIEVKRASDEDEIIRAVNDSPNSCMGGLSFDGYVHPAACYDTEDFDVLYAEIRGDIVARVICNAKTKKAARIYAGQDVEARFRRSIVAMGYEQEEGALIGCRLLKLEDYDRHIMPYVDAGTSRGEGCLYYKSLDSKYWVLTRHDGDSTYCGFECKGLTRDDRETCDCCGDREDDCEEVRNGDMVCSSCRENCYAWCDREQFWAEADECIYCESDGEWYYHPDRYDVYQCYERGDWYYIDDLCCVNGRYYHIYLCVEIDGEWYLESDCTDTEHDGWVPDDDVETCEITGKDGHRDNFVEVGDYWVHKDEYERLGSDEAVLAEIEGETAVAA